MSLKKRGLGRGLDALLASAAAPESSGVDNVGTETGLQQLALHLIQRGKYQPRRDIDPQALEELSRSIKAQGVMQPIVVRPLEGQMYEIIAGERRWRASQMAGLDTIPVVVRDVSDEAAIAMALIENIQREDLNPIEEAIALARLQNEFELTQQQVADAVGKSRTAIANLLRLNNLTEEVKRLVEHGDIEMGHARALLGLEGELQVETGREVAAKGLTVRQTEALVKKLQAPVEERKIEPEKPDHAINEWAESLSSRLDAPVSIGANAKGAGKIVINFSNKQALERLIKKLS